MIFDVKRGMLRWVSAAGLLVYPGGCLWVLGCICLWCDLCLVALVYLGWGCILGLTFSWIRMGRRRREVPLCVCVALRRR